MAIRKGPDRYLDRRQQVRQGSQRRHQRGGKGQLVDHDPIERAVDRHQGHGDRSVNHTQLDAFAQHQPSRKNKADCSRKPTSCDGMRKIAKMYQPLFVSVNVDFVDFIEVQPGGGVIFESAG